jgi:hypothetical protein
VVEVGFVSATGSNPQTRKVKQFQLSVHAPWLTDAKTLVEPSESEREALPIAMGGVLCTKNQVYRSLLECELKREASTCGHNKDIGLECLGTRMPPVPQLAAGATRHEVHLEPNMMQRLDGLKEFDQLRFWWTAASGSGSAPRL